MLLMLDKRILNILVIIALTIVTFAWTFWIFHHPIQFKVVAAVIIVRVIASIFLFKDYSLSWSKVTQKTFLLKSLVYIIAFCVYAPLFYTEIRLALMLSELFLYLFSITFVMYLILLYCKQEQFHCQFKINICFQSGFRLFNCVQNILNSFIRALTCTRLDISQLIRKYYSVYILSCLIN